MCLIMLCLLLWMAVSLFVGQLLCCRLCTSSEHPNDFEDHLTFAIEESGKYKEDSKVFSFLSHFLCFNAVDNQFLEMWNICVGTNITGKLLLLKYCLQHVLLVAVYVTRANFSMLPLQNECTFWTSEAQFGWQATEETEASLVLV